ncbi:hypothetical protein LCGC14_1135580 [marine sediment metagenome]|uniref:Uncharacterized protein n=1 Tax=marine sediment metagenome TaxID=412755 RepID=A0A0F9Q5H8_9ZZZZ
MRFSSSTEIDNISITYLARKFVIYLALAHRKAKNKTRALLNMNGGYILHLDGTCEGVDAHINYPLCAQLNSPFHSHDFTSKCNE